DSDATSSPGSYPATRHGNTTDSTPFTSPTAHHSTSSPTYPPRSDITLTEAPRSKGPTGNWSGRHKPSRKIAPSSSSPAPRPRLRGVRAVHGNQRFQSV